MWDKVKWVINLFCLSFISKPCIHIIIWWDLVLLFFHYLFLNSPVILLHPQGTGCSDWIGGERVMPISYFNHSYNLCVHVCVHMCLRACVWAVVCTLYNSSISRTFTHNTNMFYTLKTFKQFQIQTKRDGQRNSS